MCCASCKEAFLWHRGLPEPRVPSQAAIVWSPFGCRAFTPDEQHAAILLRIIMHGSCHDPAMITPIARNEVIGLQITMIKNLGKEPWEQKSVR